MTEIAIEIAGSFSPTALAPSSDPLEGTPVLPNLWHDRRICQNDLDVPDRRSGLDRRQLSADITADRRAHESRRAMWRSGKLERVALVFGDVFALLAAFAVAGVLAAGFAPDLHPLDFDHWWMEKAGSRLPLLLGLVLFVTATFWIKGHYSKRKPFWDELPQTLKVIGAAGILDGALVFFGHLDFSRVWLLSTWLIALALVPLLRVQVKHLLISLGGWMRPTIIIGTGNNAKDAARALRSERLLGFQITGFAELSEEATGAPGVATSTIEVDSLRLPVYRLNEAPHEVFRRLGKPQVVVALEDDNPTPILELLAQYSDSYASLRIVPPLRGLPLLRTKVTHFFRHEAMMLEVQDNLARPMPRRLKRTFDVVAALLAVIVLSPMLLAIAFCLKRTSGSPMFAHERIGQDGRLFQCYKFRTMVENADEVLNELLASDPSAREEWETNFKLHNDPRITKLGAFLRRTVDLH